jgi:DNA-binding response OmpR family regulator
MTGKRRPALTLGGEQGMGKHVLLIEDEPNITEAIRFILVRDGWSVSTHQDGADAMAVIARLAPDVVILDLMLPGRSGFDILQDLRADPVTRDLPVMMLTAKGQTRDREMAERYGASRFMSKPFGNAEFLASVRDMVRG